MVGKEQDCTGVHGWLDESSSCSTVGRQITIEVERAGSARRGAEMEREEVEKGGAVEAVPV